MLSIGNDLENGIKRDEPPAPSGRIHAILITCGAAAARDIRAQWRLIVPPFTFARLALPVGLVLDTRLFQPCVLTVVYCSNVGYQ